MTMIIKNVFNASQDFIWNGLMMTYALSNIKYYWCETHSNFSYILLFRLIVKYLTFFR